VLYFVIYAPISAITLVLVCSSFDCRFTCDEPSNRRKNEIEGLEDQEELQKKPNRPNTDDPRQKPTDQKCTKTQRLRSVGTGPGRNHHRQPVVFAMARGGGRTAVLPGTQGHASLLPRLRRFSFAAFRLPA